MSYNLRKRGGDNEPEQEAPISKEQQPKVEQSKEKVDKNEEEQPTLVSPSSTTSLKQSITETTKMAWERVTQSYKRDSKPTLKHINYGYQMLDPLASFTIVALLSFIVFDILVYEVYFSYDNVIFFLGHLQRNIIAITITVVLLFLLQVAYSTHRPRPVYLVNFETFKPEEKYRVTQELFMEMSRECGAFDEAAISFQDRLLMRNGLGNNTYFPPAVFKYKEIGEAGGDSSKVLTMESAREEAELVMFGVVENLLKANNLEPKDIDILIVNCSLFNPTPSLSAMIVNHFKMRDNVRTYNLSGMGCSAGLISVDLAKDLLQVHKESNCIIVSTENITENWYLGKQKSMLLTNTLFRMGGAAIFLSNKSSDRSRAKYTLQHTVRTHRGGDDGAYQSVYQVEDEDGITGVRLSKSIMDVSGVALRQNITTLGPLILPISEQIQFFINLIRRKWLKHDVKPFMPNFRKAVQHFCIHTGGRAVIDTLETVLTLTKYDCEPSRFALERFGNTSSASVWYELEFCERDGRIKKGDQIWQIAFGSGFKCNSGIWRATRDIEGTGTDY